MTGYTKQTLYVRYTPNGNVVATLPAGYRVSGFWSATWLNLLITTEQLMSMQLYSENKKLRQ